MHYNAQVVSEDLHQTHQRHIYGIQQRLQDPGSSPRSEEDVRSPIEPRVRSPEEIRFVGTRSPDNNLDDRTQTSVRYQEEHCNKRYTKDHTNQNYFQEHDSNVTSRKCYTDDMINVTINNRCRESDLSPGRTSSPQGYTLSTSSQHNSSGKTSFCIDALLGRASTGKQHNNDTDEHDREKIFSIRNLKNVVQESTINIGNSSIVQSSSSVQGRESPCSIVRRNDDQRTTGISLGNPLNPFIQQQQQQQQQQQHQRSISPQGIESSRQDNQTNNRDNNFLTGLHNNNDPNIQIPRNINTVYRNDRLETVEDDGSIEVDPSRTTGSTSPGSNASHSPTSSPPISPGSEDVTSNSVLGHQSLGPGPYAVGPGSVVRQNQGLLFNPGGPLIHTGGLYYHPASGSAFHSIHKEGQPVVGHPQSTGPHPQQHHIHQLQLEWLARTGMLYPRLPADLAGK
ncbi:hypothetical protein M0802_013837 [Mischocyttarus mexicanus]|nr:hypothetical protein M0802_013842 [Mischocyttarus mexicanus]KAI4481921.1 hypothetical protein M0802_013837 [Mischocyttarus mexicanus]